jgi:hypothetical protein
VKYNRIKQSKWQKGIEEKRREKGNKKTKENMPEKVSRYVVWYVQDQRFLFASSRVGGLD